MLIWVFDLVVLEEVDELTLMRLEVHLGCELMDSELLHDLENIELLIKLFASFCVQEVFSLALWPQTQAALLIKGVQPPESSIGIVKALP